jgi:AraC-like DNA-binding protein
MIEIFLLKRLNHSETIDHLVRSVVETILTGNGQLTIDELSKQTPINRRQLERKFHQSIGLSPKQLSKIIRLQAAIKMLLNHEFTNLTNLAHENDYYDQSHFIKDFKELVGVTPKELYGNNLKMNFLLNGN